MFILHFWGTLKWGKSPEEKQLGAGESPSTVNVFMPLVQFFLKTCKQILPYNFYMLFQKIACAAISYPCGSQRIFIWPCSTAQI